MSNILRYFWVFALVGFTGLVTTVNGSTMHLIMDRLVYGHGEIAYGVVVVEGAKVHNKIIKIEAYSFEKRNLLFSFYIKMVGNKGEFYIPILDDYELGAYKLDLICLIDKDPNLQNGSFMQPEQKHKNLFLEQEVVTLGSSVFNIIGDKFKAGDSKYYYNQAVNHNLIKDSFALLIAKAQGQNAFGLDLKALNRANVQLVTATDSMKSNLGLQVTTFTVGWSQEIFNRMSEKIFTTFKVMNKGGHRKFNLLGLYSDDLAYTYTSKSSDKGDVYFKLEDFEGNHTFQLLVMQRESEDIEFAPYVKASSNTTMLQAIEDEVLFRLVKEANLRKTIHRYFSVQTFGTELPIRQKKKKIEDAQKIYLTNNYKRFPDFKTFCIENNVPLVFTTKNDAVNAVLTPPSIYSKTFGAVWEFPLFIMDGRIVKDINGIANLKMEDLQEVRIYFETKQTKDWLSAFGSQGVVVISSKPSKLNRVETGLVTIHGLQPKIIPAEQLVKSAMETGIPFLSPTIYWSTQIDQSGIINIQNNIDSSTKLLSVFYFRDGKLHISDVMTN